MEERIVEQVMRFARGEHAPVVAWLQALGCKLVDEEPGRQWTFDGVLSNRAGIAPGLGPLDLTPVFGFLLMGIYWMELCPKLMEKVDKAVKAAKKQGETMATRKTPKPEDTFRVELNGHSLTGEKRGGTWTFTCPSWPELAREHSGGPDLERIVSVFMARALAGAITITEE